MNKFKEGLQLGGAMFMVVVTVTFGLGFILLPIAIPIILIGAAIYAIR